MIKRRSITCCRTPFQQYRNKTGLIYLVAGEIDVLTMYEAGIQNAICWLSGESSVPSSLAGDLQRWGVSKVVYFTDRDETGRLSAEKVGRMLCEQSIEYTAIKLPDFLGDKGDINDLWKWFQFDEAAFVTEVGRLQTDLGAIMLHQPANTPCPPHLEDTTDQSPHRAARTSQSRSHLSSTSATGHLRRRSGLKKRSCLP